MKVITFVATFFTIMVVAVVNSKPAEETVTPYTDAIVEKLQASLKDLLERIQAKGQELIKLLEEWAAKFCELQVYGLQKLDEIDVCLAEKRSDLNLTLSLCFKDGSTAASYCDVNDPNGNQKLTPVALCLKEQLTQLINALGNQGEKYRTDFLACVDEVKAKAGQ